MTQHNIYTLNNEDAVRITPNGLHSGMDITLQNVSPMANIFVGGEGVTLEDYGYRIQANSAISFELPESDSLYVIADTDGAQLAVIQIGLESR
jgi:hypothetical protein